MSNFLLGNNYGSLYLGFIKTVEALVSGNEDLLKEGVALLQTGIAAKEKDVKEGRFYVYLGDGLRRLGRFQEADLVSEEGAKLGLYPSFWQRSLFNVDGLKAQPLWTVAETGVEAHLKTLLENWKTIRKEAMEVPRDVEQSGYEWDTTNLSNSGQWAEFELYKEGKKVGHNCMRAPVTCELVEKMPEIRLNQRGQVKFSLLKAGTHIYSHVGPTNVRLRAQVSFR
jgi:aspartate beta-hydroxylase